MVYNGWFSSLTLFYSVMSQSIPTGYIPPTRATPGQIFLSERIPATRANFPAPGAKNDGRIPQGGAKFSQTRRNCSLSLQKILKKLRKLRESTILLFEELNKTFIFLTEAEPLESLRILQP